MISTKELRKICQKDPETEFWLARVYGARVSIYFTRIFLALGLTSNQITVLGVLTGMVGGVFFAFPASWSLILGVILLHCYYLWDFCDGEVARFRGIGSYGGAYMDWLGHFYVPAMVMFFTGYGLFRQTGSEVWIILGFTVAIFFAFFPFSCKEHIIVDYLRRKPENFDLPLVKNALSDHPAAPGQVLGQIVDKPVSQIASLRFKGLGEFFIFPGFVAIVAIVMVLDVILDVPYFRMGFLALWTLVLGLHQLKTIIKNFQVLKALPK